LNTLIITLSRDFFSITFVAHPHSRWFIVSHVLRAQLTEVIKIGDEEMLTIVFLHRFFIEIYF
ncbi:hypothetical protein DOS71_02100, partial [Staphylococcus felis]|uniref:hypothetical protein n=1 Tax=Staphylococcus felis TaxID=46127 RepID=UPI000E3B5388